MTGGQALFAALSLISGLVLGWAMVRAGMRAAFLGVLAATSVFLAAHVLLAAPGTWDGLYRAALVGGLLPLLPGLVIGGAVAQVGRARKGTNR